MRAGKLNTRIKIMAPNPTKGDYGEPVEGAGTEVVTLWAEKRDVSGNERWANEHVKNTANVSFRVRYREDIDPKYWVEHKGLKYSIVGYPIDPDGRRTDLIIACERVTT